MRRGARRCIRTGTRNRERIVDTIDQQSGTGRRYGHKSHAPIHVAGCSCCYWPWSWRWRARIRNLSHKFRRFCFIINTHFSQLTQFIHQLSQKPVSLLDDPYNFHKRKSHSALDKAFDFQSGRQQPCQHLLCPFPDKITPDISRWPSLLFLSLFFSLFFQLSIFFLLPHKTQ